MRVALYIANNGWMEDAFAKALTQAGVDTYVHFYSNQYSRRHFTLAENEAIAKANFLFKKEVIAAHGKSPFDCIFFCACDDYILPATLKELRRLSIPLINYHPDMGLLWFRLLRTGQYYDLVACAQSSYISALRKRGINARFVPFGAHPVSIGHAAKLPFFNGVRYLGSPFPDRAKILGRLHAKGLPLDIHGHHWYWFPRASVKAIQVVQKGFRLPFLTPREVNNLRYLLPRLLEEPAILAHLLKKELIRYRKKMPFDTEGFYGHIPASCIHGNYAEDDFEALVGSAAINVGFSHMHPLAEMKKQQWQMRLRDVEIPMAGGFYLAEYSEDLVHCFEPGRHIAIWHTEEELFDKAAYYLANPSQAKKIALAGRQHALSHHTWAHRFNKIFDLLKIKSRVPV